MKSVVLGISAYYHDSGAALIVDGKVVAACQEERFSRKKHDERFPANAIRSILDESGVLKEEIDLIAFYDKPLLKFERLIKTYHEFAPRGLKSFVLAMPVWIREKLFTKKLLRDELGKLGISAKQIIFPEHHLSHAASAFFASPYGEAAILTIDGVGEWATTTISSGEGKDITVLKQLNFPHSVGLLYSAFTYFIGFKVNSGEYKLMGLAPYGVDCDQTKQFERLIKEELVSVKGDGSIALNMEYFDFATGTRMCSDDKWMKLFGMPKRDSESPITQDHMNLALACQNVTEEIVIQLARTARSTTGKTSLVMSGGVALNCVANGKLLESGIFESIWIQPAAGDAGGALGCALAAWHIYLGRERNCCEDSEDAMMGGYLGPKFSSMDIDKMARRNKGPFEYYENFNELADHVAKLISQGKIIGWFQGRMEFGPRALGNRSILGDARDPEMQKKLNLKIKYREGFRPFAPSVLEEDIGEYFDISDKSPYMLMVAPVNEARRNIEPEGYSEKDLWDKLYHVRSDIPAVTHVDYSARIQSVRKRTNVRFWTLINSFKEQTGVGLVVNTSFNVRGEPIVCTPDDAYRCFMRTEMDYLVIGNHIFDKNEQKQVDLLGEDNWQQEFELD